MFGSFYGRLRELRDYHRKFPNLYHEPEKDDFQPTLDDDSEIMVRHAASDLKAHMPEYMLPH